ncbi:extracellular serine/threonine protein kinase FAM20C-like [Haliotis rufescens]|uniref:extracellular serine/threonine protein kinase FAM20C-like n=1 Tax=Haliotis rufescens TaxID=6454 RepID=UPI00201EAEA0|nr:extracellular serine/threonine protein kinase FAM20C-like [Haliotis rufescens]
MPRCRRKLFVIVCVICTFVLCLNTLIVPRLSNTATLAEGGGGSHPHPVQDFGDSAGLAHLPAWRKRLNKSNYTSDTSPEGEGVGVGDHEPYRLNYMPQQKANERDPEKPLKHVQENNNVSSNPRTFKSNYSDQQLDNFLHVLNRINNESFPFSTHDEVPLFKFLRMYRKSSTRKGFGLPVYKNYKGVTNWERFHMGIHQYGLYSQDDHYIDDLLKDLATLPVVDVKEMHGGSQLKLITTYSNKGQALLKPRRFPRTYETPPDHFYFLDFERHNAEIAAFNLDRLLGFHRVPPTAGRKINMTHDIKRFADHNLVKTFFYSPAGNVCFHGSCIFYCDSTHAICGNPDTSEASLATFLPPEKIAPRERWLNPWIRSYSKQRKAYWEVYDDLCDKVRSRPPYNSGRRLLDLMDITVFDFLTGNMDRHHYETFLDFGNETFIVHLDNGKSFGKTKHDEMSILAPISQCCLIRHSTFIKLVKLYRGPESLSTVMRRVLAVDMVSPVLLDPFLDSLDRRVMKVLHMVMDCVNRRGQPYKSVIVDDFF